MLSQPPFEDAQAARDHGVGIARRSLELLGSAAGGGSEVQRHRLHAHPGRLSRMASLPLHVHRNVRSGQDSNLWDPLRLAVAPTSPR